MKPNIDEVRDILTDDVLAGLCKETKDARGLPNVAFTTESFLALEQKFLFPRSWVFAGRAGDIPDAGDIQPIKVAGRALFMVRGTEEQIRVFHNVCPHRGARLVTESVRQENSLTCPYHAWTFDLDGGLKGRPHFHGPGRHDRDSNGGNDGVCLFEVRCTTWYDWVFVNLDGRATLFETYVAPVAEYFKRWDLGQFCFAHRQTFEFQCNWKLAVENYMDNYHVFKVHAKLNEMYVPAERSPASPEGVHMVISNRLAGRGRGLTLDEEGPTLPGLAGITQETDSIQPTAALFPNVTMTISPGNLQFIQFEAAGPQRCLMHMCFYFVGDAATAPEHEAAREMVYAEWASLNREDEDVCRRMQEGRGCDAYDGGRQAPFWDRATAHFHSQIANALIARGEFARIE